MTYIGQLDITIEPETLPDFYYLMATIRSFELKVKEMVQLNLVGGAIDRSIGQEVVPVEDTNNFKFYNMVRN